MWIDGAARLGYHVGYFGKWHLGPINPEARGAHRFDPDSEAQRRPYDPRDELFLLPVRQRELRPADARSDQRAARLSGVIRRSPKKRACRFR